MSRRIWTRALSVAMSTLLFGALMIAFGTSASAPAPASTVPVLASFTITAPSTVVPAAVNPSDRDDHWCDHHRWRCYDWWWWHRHHHHDWWWDHHHHDWWD